LNPIELIGKIERLLLRTGHQTIRRANSDESYDGLSCDGTFVYGWEPPWGEAEIRDVLAEVLRYLEAEA